MLTEKDLAGVWRLVAHSYLEDDGTISEGPMGAHADGLLIYHEDGYVAASLMRTGAPAGAQGAAPHRRRQPADHRPVGRRPARRRYRVPHQR